jgi:benzoyl-CoA reductase/2-hydroxyglutaryl-CoA dehydratase subunit BcrC/BadD/HgdB
MIQMMMGDYAQDPEGLHRLFRQLFEEIELRVKQGKKIAGISESPIRVYIIGDETLELYMYNLIEDYGGAVVGCNFRLPLYYELIDEQALSIESLAHWIWNMPINLPFQKRIEFELQRIKKQKTDAVIISSVVGSRCAPGVERLFRDSIKKELGIPVIEVETTIPGDNVERLDYQIRGLLQTMND